MKRLVFLPDFMQRTDASIISEPLEKLLFCTTDSCHVERQFPVNALVWGKEVDDYKAIT